MVDYRGRIWRDRVYRRELVVKEYRERELV